MVQLKVTQVGNSIGLVLPKEALSRLNVTKGDALFLIETPDGYTMTAYDPGFAEELKFAEEGSRKYKNALKELAK
jgi:putative addiction module antidote